MSIDFIIIITYYRLIQNCIVCRKTNSIQNQIRSKTCAFVTFYCKNFPNLYTVNLLAMRMLFHLIEFWLVKRWNLTGVIVVQLCDRRNVMSNDWWKYLCLKTLISSIFVSNLMIDFNFFVLSLFDRTVFFFWI